MSNLFERQPMTDELQDSLERHGDLCCHKHVPPASALAEAHVDWFLETIRPLLITHFIHGFKHGEEAKRCKKE